MDGLKAARAGIRPKKDEEHVAQARERFEKADHFLKSDVWQFAKGRVRQSYVELLKTCPTNDDMQRYRLVEAIRIVDIVEQHIISAYSNAEVDLEKDTRRDFRTKRGLFR